MIKYFYVLTLLALGASNSIAQENIKGARSHEIEMSNGSVDEEALSSFFDSMQETQLKNEQDKNCRTVCYPCCYAPRGCWTECDNSKEDESHNVPF